MQDPNVDTWTRETPITGEIGRTLRELNRGFLDLDGIAAPGLVALPAARKASIADCPYALFDLRFDEDAYWRTRLEIAMPDRVAESPAGPPQVVAFVRLALIYAWHLATSANLQARLLFGMSARTARAFADETVVRLTQIADAEAVHLAPRWPRCSAFWDGLAEAAEAADRARLRRIQLYGLQLAVAKRLR
ncbi:MAG: hypothetical protein KGL36_00320 [Gammaproteobacteria bacterium]|nr:hypothetical protein [Gammaproteobacteria bacterium]